MRVSTSQKGKQLWTSLISCMIYSWSVGVSVSLTLMGLIFFSADVNATVSDDVVMKGVQSLSELEAGQLVFRTDKDAYLISPKVNTEVDIEVNGLLARVTLSQTFTNPSDHWQEGIYVFPLPETAAVDHLRMKVGERIIEGEIKEKQQARRIYQQAKQEGKHTSLVEQQRPNMFTTSVANIAPKDSITVVIEYQQTVTQEENEFSLRFPMAMTPRYIPGRPIENSQEISHFNGSGWAENTDQVPDASHITPAVISQDREPEHRVNLSVLLAAGFELESVKSSYHQIEGVIVDKRTRKVRLIDDVAADRDFELVWRARDNKTPQAAMFRQNKNGEDYAMLMLTPPNSLHFETISRELIFIVDTSGSMDGTSIKQAKSALHYGLTNLRPQDSFNIIRFSDDVDSLFRQAKVASKVNIDHAHDYVNWLRAGGGTEMAPALEMALQAKHVTPGIRQVVFLTDGSVGNENELFSIIERDLGKSRLFTIGIGSAPNSHFMNRAARFGRGDHSYIGSEDEVRQKMQSLFNKLSHPVLTDINIQLAGNVDILPNPISDLYLGKPLLLALKATNLPDELIISGFYGDRLWQNKVTLQGGGKSDLVSVLWARRKIEGLMDEYRRAGEDRELYKEDIVEIALAHHLVSKFTSLVAVDKTSARSASEKLNTKAIAINAPAGSVMSQLPQTATPAALQIMLGLISLFIGVCLRWRWS